MLIDKLRRDQGPLRIQPKSMQKRFFLLADRKAMLWKRQPSWKDSLACRPSRSVTEKERLLRNSSEESAGWLGARAPRCRVSRQKACRELLVCPASETAQRSRTYPPVRPVSITMLHLVMKSIDLYECGYSSAALRERLYISGGENPDGRNPHLHGGRRR